MPDRDEERGQRGSQPGGCGGPSAGDRCCVRPVLFGLHVLHRHPRRPGATATSRRGASAWRWNDCNATAAAPTAVSSTAATAICSPAPPSGDTGSAASARSTPAPSCRPSSSNGLTGPTSPRDLARIAEIGGRTWLVEATIRHACPDCGTLNSAYDLTCRACGRDPSSPYVAEHRELILAGMRRQ